MREYKVVVKLSDGKWYLATGGNVHRKRIFKSWEEAQEYLEEYKRGYLQDRLDAGMDRYKGAELKIMSRKVSEWE